MDITSDAGALAFQGALSLQNLQFTSHPSPHDPSHCQPDTYSAHNHSKCLKPLGLPKVSQLGECERSAIFIPKLIIIACGYSKYVIAWRQITIGRGPFASIYPVGVQRFQLVPEPNLVRGHEA